jgi:hypothetical protein
MQVVVDRESFVSFEPELAPRTHTQDIALESVLKTFTPVADD